MKIRKLSNALRTAKSLDINEDLNYDIYPCPQGVEASLRFDTDSSFRAYENNRPSPITSGFYAFTFIQKDQFDTMLNSILVGVVEPDPVIVVHGWWAASVVNGLQSIVDNKFIITHVTSDGNIYSADELEIIAPNRTYIFNEFTKYSAKVNLFKRANAIDTIKAHSDIIAEDSPIQDDLMFRGWNPEDTIWICRGAEGRMNYELSFITNTNTLKTAHESTKSNVDKGIKNVEFLDSLPLDSLMRADGITYMQIHKLPEDHHHTLHFIRYICTEVAKLEAYKQGLVKYGVKEEEIINLLQARIRNWWMRWISK